MPECPKRRILIVDDIESIRKLVALTLSDERYEVLTADGGMQGLRLAQDRPPALVLLDIEMPDINGFEVCRQLKSDPRTKEATVVMLTGLAQESDKARCREAGADDYFVKPFSPLALLRKVEEVFPDSDCE
jgi:two-component system, OmpR family, phosphate regulon response regulator PhoB